MTSAQQAAYEVVYEKLRSGSPLWGTRVQPLETAGTDLVRPYVVFFQATGGRDLVTNSKKNATITLNIKGVAEDVATALQIQDALSALLDDSGRQDVSANLPVHPAWDVLTVTQDTAIWVQEQFGGKNIYHAGHQYVLKMERKP